MHERVHAKAQAIVERVRKVDLEVLLKRAALRVVHDLENQTVRFLREQTRKIDPRQLAVEAQHRRLAGRDVQVRCSTFDREAQQGRHGDHGGLTEAVNPRPVLSTELALDQHNHFPGHYDAARRLA